MSDDQILDARGLLCPLPVLKVQKRMRSLDPGEALTVLTDDPAAEIDVPHYCAESGNTLESQEDHEGGHVADRDGDFRRVYADVKVPFRLRGLRGEG